MEKRTKWIFKKILIVIVILLSIFVLFMTQKAIFFSNNSIISKDFINSKNSSKTLPFYKKNIDHKRKREQKVISITELTIQNYEQDVMNLELPVLIDFWATWCNPCKIMAPIIDEIAEEQKGKVKVYKVNIDEQSELANQFNITRIPTFVVIQNGKLVESSVGVQDKNKIIKMLGL